MSIKSEIDRIKGEVNAQADLIAQIQTALEGKVAGVSGGATIGIATVTPGSNSRNISFTGLSEQPKMFAVLPGSNTALSTSTQYATSVVYDGEQTIGVYSNKSTATYTTDGFTHTYSDGTLTINTASTTNGGYFKSGVTYQLIYVV